MKDSEIDAAILSSADDRFLKVAWVIIETANRLGVKSQNTRRIVKRLAVLVEQGRWVAAGDITRWRHSEIRLADHERPRSRTKSASSR